MNPADNRSPQTPLQRPTASAAPTARSICPECLCAFQRLAPNQLFCGQAHRKTWETRTRLRALRIFPLVMVARITREGTRANTRTGGRAAAERNMLLQQWIEEDRAAGRMPWPDYLDRRYAIGFEAIR